MQHKINDVFVHEGTELIVMKEPNNSYDFCTACFFNNHDEIGEDGFICTLGDPTKERPGELVCWSGNRDDGQGVRFVRYVDYALARLKGEPI